MDQEENKTHWFVKEEEKEKKKGQIQTQTHGPRRKRNTIKKEK